MAQYPLMENEQTKRVPVPLTHAQHAALTAAAKRRGLTLAAFIRMAAIERAASDREGNR